MIGIASGLTIRLQPIRLSVGRGRARLFERNLSCVFSLRLGVACDRLRMLVTR